MYAMTVKSLSLSLLALVSFQSKGLCDILAPDQPQYVHINNSFCSFDDADPQEKTEPLSGITGLDDVKVKTFRPKAKKRVSEILKAFGFRHGIEIRTTAASSALSKDLSASAKSDALQVANVNALFGFAKKRQSREYESVVVNVSNQSQMNTDDNKTEVSLGRKLLLPDQHGLVVLYNRNVMGRGLNKSFKIVSTSPVDFDENDTSDARTGFFIKGGISPFSWTSDTKNAKGWISFGSFGMQYDSSKLSTNATGDSAGSIGYSLRLGITGRSFISTTGDVSSFFYDKNFFGGTAPDQSTTAPSRLRTILGIEASTTISIGQFKPTLQYTYFRKSSNIPGFSGSQVNLFFNFDQLFNTPSTKSPKLGKILSILRHVSHVEKAQIPTKKEVKRLTEASSSKTPQNETTQQKSSRERANFTELYNQKQEEVLNKVIEPNKYEYFFSKQDVVDIQSLLLIINDNFKNEKIKEHINIAEKLDGKSWRDIVDGKDSTGKVINQNDVDNAKDLIKYISRLSSSKNDTVKISDAV